MRERNTILIVDDYAFNRLLLSEMFPEKNIIEAENGSIAIEKYEQHKDEICAVLSDVMMPVTDGYGLMEYFSKNKYLDDTPMFIVSADNSNKLVSKAFQLGVEDVITKPFNVNFAKKHINHIIELFELRRQMNDSSADALDDEFE